MRVHISYLLDAISNPQVQKIPPNLAGRWSEASIAPPDATGLEHHSLLRIIHWILSGGTVWSGIHIHSRGGRIVPHPVVHFEILGHDQKLLGKFYKNIFNWEITPVEDWYSLVKPGAGINGGIGAREGHTGHVTFYVAVEDVTAALATGPGVALYLRSCGS